MQIVFQLKQPRRSRFKLGKMIISISRIYCGILFLLISSGVAQDKNYTIVLNRGRLWHALDYAQECEPLADWTRKTYGLDWPGYDTAELPADIGGSNSYLVSGGFYITARNDNGTVWGWDDFAINARSGVEWSGDNYRYHVKKHEKRWKNGENYWLAVNPAEAEEIIDTYWEINRKWYEPSDNRNLPIGVRRTVRQWSGSRADEDYLIIEYQVQNQRFQFSGRDTLHQPLNGVYLLFTYALSPNHRGWRLTFPNLPEGARNTRSSFDPLHRTVVSWAGDYSDTPLEDESFDLFYHTRFDPVNDRFYSEPEFLAPGFMGIQFLYISPDSTGQENRINRFVWSAASPSNDHSGPFLGVAGLPAKYAAMADPGLLSEAFDEPDDGRMGKNRIYANFSLGPYNLPPKGSIRIVLAEFVGGAPYEKAIAPETVIDQVTAAGDSAVQYLVNRVKFNYDHNFTVPVPPAPPAFTVTPVDSSAVVANLITFSDSSEYTPDPQQGVVDIAGYRIYRSENFPFGPWQLIADIPVGDPDIYQPLPGEYVYLDNRVALGFEYFYSVTAYDNGHANWVMDDTCHVPPLESSIFAGRGKNAFLTTLKPTAGSLDKISVVPNPFYRHSGLQKEGNENRISFVNLPQECTIRIYTLRGDLVKTIHHNEPGSGLNYWNQITDNGQLVKSGMYFYHIENKAGDVKHGKFAIVK